MPPIPGRSAGACCRATLPELGSDQRHIERSIFQAKTRIEHFGRHTERKAIDGGREPRGQMPGVGEENCVCPVSVGQPQIGMEVVLPVVRPEEGRNIRRALHLERRIWAFHEDDEVGCRVHLIEIDAFGLEPNVGTASAQSCLQVLARVGVGLPVADHDAPVVVSSWLGVREPMIEWGVKCSESTDRAGELRSRRCEAYQVDVGRAVHLRLPKDGPPTALAAVTAPTSRWRESG